jgi:hypothetical protein
MRYWIGGLFWQARKGGKLVHQAMTDDAVWRLIEKPKWVK